MLDPPSDSFILNILSRKRMLGIKLNGNLS